MLDQLVPAAGLPEQIPRRLSTFDAQALGFLKQIAKDVAVGFVAAKK